MRPAPPTLPAPPPPPPPVVGTVPPPPTTPGATPPPPPPTLTPEPAAPAAPAAPEADKDKESKPASDVTITLAGESKGITPCKHGDAKVEEGKIDVTTEANGLKAVLTGGVGANVFFGAESIATQSFVLVQEFDVASPSASAVTLNLESSLVGFVRGKHKGSACVRLASAMVAPSGSATAVVSLAHPALCVAGPSGHCAGPYGQMNKDPLPGTSSGPLPPGRYVLTAYFILQATAGGVLDGHSTAIFAPEPKELDPWEREHDMFKGEDKAGFGYNIAVTADAVGAPPSGMAARLLAPKPRAARVASKPAVRR
jgi:hypothetical protein